MLSNPTTSPPPKPVWKTLVEFRLPSLGSGDHSAQEQVAAAMHKLKLSAGNLERLKSAIAEASLKALEWPELSIFIRVLVSEGVTPEGEPNLLSETVEGIANVAEPAAGRGWGFFLIHKMKSEGEACYSIELFLYREEGVS